MCCFTHFFDRSLYNWQFMKIGQAYVEDVNKKLRIKVILP